MAKGLRSKVKRRIRAARREHFMKVQGMKDLEEFNKRLTDPNSNINVTCNFFFIFSNLVKIFVHINIYFENKSCVYLIWIGGVKPNAFLEPNNIEASIPQRKKENNIDFRSTAIEGFGRTSRYTTRGNIPGSNRKVSKYATIVQTAEDLEREGMKNCYYCNPINLYQIYNLLHRTRKSRKRRTGRTGKSNKRHRGIK